MPIFRAGQTVTLVNRVVTGQDGYNNDVYGEETRQVNGCAIAPGNTSEDIQGTSSVVSDVILHMPVGTDVGSFDFVILPGAPDRFRVVGMPKSWASPFTGGRSLLEVPLQLVTGALEGFPASTKAAGA